MTNLTTQSRWTRVRCPVPRGSERADAFLTTLLGPALNGMVADGQVCCWLFERAPGPAIRLHAWEADRPVLMARLTGLVAATQPHREPVALLGPGTPTPTALPTLAPELSSRSTQVALDVIAATPTHRSRLRTAVDLAITTAIGMDLHSADALARLALCDDIDPAAATLGMLVCPRGLDESAPTHGGQWRRIRDVLRTGSGHLARWAGCLAELGASATGPATAMHRLLNNQLGLGVDDERRIYGTVVMSLPGAARRRRVMRPRVPVAARCAYRRPDVATSD